MPLIVPPFSLAPVAFWSRAADTPPQLIARLHDKLAQLRRADRAAQTDEHLRGVISGVRYEAYVAYLAEACQGEALGTQTIEETRAALATSTNELSLQQIEARNLGQAAQAVLEEATPFSVDRIFALHEAIGEGLINNAGKLRTTAARPLGVALMYLHPGVIRSALDDLVAATQAWDVLDIEGACKRAAFFMARFLLIHPFSDGNGRVARVCVSWLMKDFAFSPISLHTGPKSRQHLLDCLFTAQNDSSGKAGELALYILWSACTTAVNARLRHEPVNSPLNTQKCSHCRRRLMYRQADGCRGA